MFLKRSYSDREIVDAITSSGREEGRVIAHLLESNRGKVHGLILKMGGNKSDAENALIEGVTSVVLNIRKGSFKGDSAISTYLYSICRRIWLKSIEKEKRYSDWNESQNDLDSEVSPLTVMNEDQLKRDIDLLLSKLGKACQTVLKMWAAHYSMTEIAAKLEYKNAQIAMNKKNKCLKKMKEIVLENEVYTNELSTYLYKD